ncbi:TPA: phage tail tip fiber protein [Acinetobacter baumannii]
MDYATKSETDSAIASKIESYDANLVIGGTNLMEYTSGNAAIYGTHITYDAATNSFIKPSGSINYTAFRLDSFKPKLGEVYTVSGYLFVDEQPANYSNYWTAHSTINTFQKSIGAVNVKSDGYFYGTFEVTNTSDWGKLHFFFPTGTLLDESLHTLRFKDLQLEKGSRPSAYSTPSYETQKSLNVNANAIQTVTAEVARVNGEVVATVNSVNNLNSNVGLLQGSINEVRQTITNNQESTNTLVTSLRSGMADADDISMMMRNATVLHEDLSFKNGFNWIGVYNNYSNGTLVANFTDKLPDNPVASTRQLEFIHSGGATTPGLGGFYQQVQSRANGVFLVKFVAKLPVGYSFDLAANAYGDGANGYFIGSSEGTGKFKTYHAVYRCGATGNFSTVGFVFVNGPQPTPENPLIWYLASSTVYDCLDSKVAPDSVLNGIAEAKSTASTAVNKAEATALLAQNLQTALDNTNANISNNYYTKSQADTATAGHISSYDANLVIGGTNLLLNSDFSDGASSDKWNSNGGGYTKVNDPIYGDVLQTHLPSGLVHAWVKLENNVEYTYSALVKPSNNLYQNGNTPLHYWAGKDNQHQNKIHVLSYSPTLIEAGKWTRISIVFKLVDDADSFRPFIFGLSGVLQLAWTKLERGNKATDWAPNSLEMKHSIDANASAVQSTRADVVRIDGVVSSQARQIVTLESSKSAIENGGIAGNDEFVIDLRDPAYNRDLYYPVLLSNFSPTARQTIRVWATLDGAAVPPWASHGGGFSLNAQFQMGGDGWGTINPEIVTDNFTYAWTHSSIPPLDEIGQISASSQPFFYVRGGGRYTLSKPASRAVQVCAPNGSLSGYYEGTLYPRPYKESTVPKSINQGLNQQNVKLQQTNKVLDGVKAVSTVTVDNNGVMSGYGLISELANGQVRSSFGVNADMFYIGSPANNKKPFAVLGSSGFINGVSVPAGTYIDTAYIPNGTINNAQIGDLSADKITTGSIAADRMKANIVAAAQGQFTSLSSISATIGVLRTSTYGARTEIKDNLIEVYDSSGKLRVRLGVW